MCKLINYYKQGLQKHESYSQFNFNWKDSNEYNDISKFVYDTMCSCYIIKKEKFDYHVLLNLVNENKIYMFQLYNKDFSKHSKGTPNLHTMYFKMLFDERNLKNVVYQLNGCAEMFYRPASIKEKDIIAHYANKPIKNKNPHSEKPESIFDYDLIKDKRFTKPQFSLHLPITLNFKANGSMKIDYEVRYALKHCDNNYVIGIDRGERNLLYVCVIDGDGNIVKQYSLNEIINIYNGKTHIVNYQELLQNKETERKKAKQNWGTVENIKELKEGYISQAVHVICQLVKKYDAVIAMEKLNPGFKHSRTKIDKQVYQKFEKMLIDKLNYMVDKNADPTENGGLLHAYQLTNKFINFESIKNQSGFIFYVPAWLTSKIDPVTGFVDLLKPKYTSIEKSKEFISHFDSILFNKNENYFEFNFNYGNFPTYSTDYRNEWTVCTNGERIKIFRNSAKNGEWDNQTVNLTDSFIDLFESANINYKDADIKDLILKVSEKDFFVKLMNLIKLTLQMRNSVTNTDIDYLISPVQNKDGVFYNSNNYDDDSTLPSNADANGA